MHSRVMACVALAMPLLAHCAGAAECSVGGGQINFGVIDTFRPETMQTVGTMILVCDAPVPWLQVRFSGGNAGHVAWRELRSGQHGLRYNLYADINQQQILGDGSPGAAGLALAPATAGEAIHVSIFAAIDSGQVFKAGTYTDQIMVTIDF